MNVGLAGNIGQSLAFQVAECNYDYYVIELSSFQLDNMYDFHANIAVLMNITPDHLDRYEYKMQNYVDAKFRIIQNQTENDAFIFWNDDLEFVLSIAYKTVKRMKREFNEDTVFFLSLYNEEEDFDLAKTLYRRSVLDMHPNMDLINQYTNNWDLDRISDIDKLVMDIAISELRYFPSIPVKVTLNEYIDISKNYGTEKSGGFINGILDKIVSELQEKGEINKMGRGLMD